MIFDLCQSVLWSKSNAQVAFREIAREIRKTSASEVYQHHERAWILEVTCRKLIRLATKHSRKLSPSEQIMLDATLTVDSRLGLFDSYFHRLGPQDQLVLLLRDKYQIPFSEIASALRTSEGSLKLRRQHALRTMEEWLWNRA